MRRRQLSLLTRNSLDNDSDEEEHVDDLCNGDDVEDDDDLNDGNDDERNSPDNNYSRRSKSGGTVGSACNVRASLRV